MTDTMIPHRENTSQIRDWAKNNFDKLDVSTGDFKIKAEFKGEFETGFPKRKVVQISKCLRVI